MRARDLGFFLRLTLGMFGMIRTAMNKPLALSLIIPAYNEEEHLQACLDSIAAQTVAPFEVLVVDNNSRDKTAQLAATYPFVRVIKAKKQGIVYARNAGFDAAKGDILGRIDSDSILPTDWVESIMNFYARSKNHNVAFTGGGTFYNVPFPALGRWLLDLLAFRVNRLTLGHHFLFGSNMALPRSVWLDVRDSVCNRTDIHEDIDIAVHIHDLHVPIVYDRKLQVGIKLRRVFQDRDKLWRNLMLWPQSLKVHGNPFWMTGWFGAVLLFALAPLLYPLKATQTVYNKVKAKRFVLDS